MRGKLAGVLLLTPAVFCRQQKYQQISKMVPPAVGSAFPQDRGPEQSDLHVRTVLVRTPSGRAMLGAAIGIPMTQ
jgi:hypothetical protein